MYAGRSDIGSLTQDKQYACGCSREMICFSQVRIVQPSARKRQSTCMAKPNTKNRGTWHWNHNAEPAGMLTEENEFCFVSKWFTMFCIIISSIMQICAWRYITELKPGMMFVNVQGTCLDIFSALEFAENTTCSPKEYCFAAINPYRNVDAMYARIMYVGLHIEPYDWMSARLAHDTQQRDCKPQVYVRISWYGKVRTVIVDDNYDTIMKYLWTTSTAN